MPAYDASRYNPPAPVAQVILRRIDAGAMATEATMLIDTGADVTFLPRASVERLGVHPLADLVFELTAFEGSRTTAQAVQAELIFLGKVFRGAFLLIDQEQGVLGRDILSNIALVLDGPRREWLEHTSPANR